MRWWRFVQWAFQQIVRVIPDADCNKVFDGPIRQESLWLDEGNPLANIPWLDRPDACLPEQTDVVVVGAGFTGAAFAYHWSKSGQSGQQMVLLEMEDPACGASGRNAGLVVTGRNFALVYSRVHKDLVDSRPELDAADRERLAIGFARAYCRAAYKNAELIEQVIQEEGFDCEYVREGWVVARDEGEQKILEEAVRLGQENGFTDYVQISAQEAVGKTGARIEHPANYSQRTAKFHPAKWVWTLLRRALDFPNISLFTRTKVLSIRDAGLFYEVATNRGTILAKYVVNATESYTPLLHDRFRKIILPRQTQLAAAKDHGRSLKSDTALSSRTCFMARRGSDILFGSDETPVPLHCVERSKPSRFISKFVVGELRKYFGSFPLRVTHEWSGTSGFTRDEFPIVGIMDGKRQYIIAGMCGSGTAVSFNAARWTCNRIRGVDLDEDDYPSSYFGPSRLLDPQNHRWPDIDPVD
jgi:gamma-glutamylputrescine oxidase